MKLNKKVKNYGLWLSISALFFMVLQDSGFNITSDRYDQYIDIVLTILVTLGIISNPESGKWFLDKVKQNDKN